MLRIFRFGERSRSRRDKWIHEMATSALPAVMRQLRADTTAMSAAELRGYLRARAREAVRETVLRHVAETRLAAAQVDELVDAVLEQAINAPMREHAASPVVAIPAPHVQQRQAA